ncbi:hypothetical protein KY310_01265 [Candidatus Woesearchaeota archaeon]|nr:hypothetical protein [Candidatus Woesearchaeota archaeon]
MDESNVNKIWQEFFGETRAERFGANNPYDPLIFDKGGIPIFKGGRILKDAEYLRLCFHLYLQDKGFVPDEVEPRLGSEFRGARLQHWLRYTRPGHGDLWVNYFGDKSPVDGAALDLILTNTPERIRIANPKNYAIAEQLEKIS